VLKILGHTSGLSSGLFIVKLNFLVVIASVYNIRVGRVSINGEKASIIPRYNVTRPALMLH
jgi:hypothetical protein